MSHTEVVQLITGGTLVEKEGQLQVTDPHATDLDAPTDATGEQS